MNNKIYSIQALRGVAALMVVLGHLNAYLNDVYTQKNLGDLLFFNGAVGVDIFFIISGFIIALATERKESSASIKFIVKRVLRIYPVYVFCFIAFTLITTGLFLKQSADIPLWFSRDNIISSLSFLPLRTGDSAPFYGYSLIITAWTLSYEIYFYILFCLAMAVSHRYRAVIASSFIVILSFLVQEYFNGSFILDAYGVTGISNSKILTVVANPISFDFILGLASYYIVMAIRKINLGTGAKLGTAIGASFAVLCWNSGFMYGHGITKFGVIAFILFLSVVIGEMAFKFKISKAFIFLGDISYSLYLCHVIVIFAYNEFGLKIPFIPQQHGFSLFAFLVLTSIVLAYALYCVIEKPSIKLSHRICSRF